MCAARACRCRLSRGRRSGRASAGRRIAFPSPEADAIEAAILERSAREEEVAQRPRRDEEINKVLHEQGLTKARELDEKMKAWRREADAQDSMFIDLTNDDE